MNDVMNMIKEFNGETYDLCYKLLSLECDKAFVFEYTCRRFSTITRETHESGEHFFTSQEIEEYTSVYGDTINGLLKSTIKKCNLGLIKPEDFYSNLWAAICSLYVSQKERAFAFYYILIDRMIPYIYLGKPLSMSNERYKEIINQNKENIDRIKYIAKSEYNQKTECASLLLNCLDSIPDYESKVVILSQGISMLSYTKKATAIELDEIIEQIDKRIKELEEEKTEGSKPEISSD